MDACRTVLCRGRIVVSWSFQQNFQQQHTVSIVSISRMILKSGQIAINSARNLRRRRSIPTSASNPDFLGNQRGCGL